MGDFTVTPESLRAVAGEWDSQQERLGAARRELFAAVDDASTAGPRVVPALEGFLSAWVDQVHTHAQAAQRHGDSLDLAAADYASVDEAGRQSLLRLLPWGAQ